jgi:hypothetical protein
MAKPTGKINRKRRRGAAKAARRARLKERQLRDAAKSPFRAGPAPGEKTTRFDINQYSGGASHIRHIGLIEKRRPQR